MYLSFATNSIANDRRKLKINLAKLNQKNVGDATNETRVLP